MADNTTATVAAARMTDGTKVYGSDDTEVRALDGVTVDFEQGKFTAIMGPSGLGKSTLMHCVAGLDDLTSGSVHIGGVELGSLSDRDLTLLRRDKVGFVFQAYNLLPTLTAAENTTLPLDLAGRRPDSGWMDQVVKSIGIADRLNHRPDELSGGQQQRVAVARALVSQPEIVFADEPTGNLGLQDRRGGARFPTHRGRRPGPDHGDGHPRRRGGRPGPPRTFPSRRTDRRRDGRTNPGPDSGPLKGTRRLRPCSG